MILMKRCFDSIVATVALVILLPVYLLTAVAVVLGDGWPVLFRQHRVGLNGRDFILWKFRTMTVRNGTEEGIFEPGNSRRLTSAGRFLRKTKLDELPQLWNVMLGTMSLVGPRPEVKKWTEFYTDRWKIVHQIRPGITDPAAIEFRNEEEMLAQVDDPERLYRELILPRKLDLYTSYVKKRSFLGDIVIIYRTIVVLFRKR